VSEWRWVGESVAAAVHDEQLAQHGGAGGLRSEDGLASALAPPLNLAAYGQPDAGVLAAAYAYGIARNHPFVDGNKRTAWVLARLFLALNNYKLGYSQSEAVAVMLRLAAGEISEEELAEWLRERISGV
jgi:death-on-curing protein